MEKVMLKTNQHENHNTSDSEKPYHNHDKILLMDVFFLVSACHCILKFVLIHKPQE